MDAPHELVILAQTGPRDAQSPVAGCIAHRHAGYDEFRQSGHEADAFVVKSEDPAYIRHTLQQLRRDPDRATALAFVDGAADEADLAVSDGRLPGSAQALIERIDQWHGRARAIHSRDDSRGPEAMLLEHMWLRPDYVLEPLAQWQHARRYRYPVLEALDRSEADADALLQRLAREGMLESAALRDRQCECEQCGSAHLNFIDVCPSCRSIEINEEAALRCCGCGLISPEQRFGRGDQRQCPKCHASLRHLGSDYDRLPQTRVCADCEQVFIEGEVEARCAICRHSMPGTQLRLRKIHAWRLSKLGCLAARGMTPGQDEPPAEARPYLPLAHLLHQLARSLEVAATGQLPGFAVAALQLENLDQLNEALGFGQTATLLDACTGRLRQSLGDDERMTRADTQTIFLLLPRADRKRLNALYGTVQQLTAQALQEHSAGPSWCLVQHQVNSWNACNEDAGELLRRLRSGLRRERHERRVA